MSRSPGRGAVVSGHHPKFWVASGLIFFANALFSIAQGYWLLGVLQMVTAGMAAVAAVDSLTTGKTEGEP
jgi:hypothetical protein